MPIFWATSFICIANESSSPLIPSATTMQASLPDWTIIPRIKSDIFTSVLISTYILDPSLLQAFLLTVKVSSIDKLPSVRRENKIYRVISLDMEEGAMACSEFFSNKTVPVAWSIKMASFAGDLINMFAAVALCDSAATVKIKHNRIFSFTLIPRQVAWAQRFCE